MTKQPTPQGISALLRKAGHKRSVSSKSRIKGMTEHSDGYEVYKHPDFDGVVHVEHHSGVLRGAQAQERRSNKLVAYAESIQASGFAVHLGHTRLTVSANEEA